MSNAAFTLVEALLCLSLIVIMGAMTTPGVTAARDTLRADGAVDYLAARLHDTRMEAMKRRAHVAIRFETKPDGIWLGTYMDGDGNGVRAADIASGVDPSLRPAERLEHHFADVTFALAPGVPEVDGTPLPTGADPIRVGTSRMVSFGPLGTSSSGTVYILGRKHRQLAVRVLGATGRVRSLRFDFSTSLWVSR